MGDPELQLAGEIAAEVERLREAIREAMGRRDAAVMKARDAGHSLRQIAEATGLSHQTIRNITKGSK